MKGTNKQKSSTRRFYWYISTFTQFFFSSEDLCSEFLRPEKIHRPQPGLNLQTLDLKTSMLPRDHHFKLNLITSLQVFLSYHIIFNISDSLQAADYSPCALCTLDWNNYVPKCRRWTRDVQTCQVLYGCYSFPLVHLVYDSCTSL